MSARKLYRYRENKIIAGVCTGFARYFEIDIVLVRLIWLVLAFTGVGLLAYIAAVFIIPYAPDEIVPEESNSTAEEEEPNHRILGILLVSLGVILLLYQFDVFNYLFSFDISWKLVWGMLLVGIGLLLLLTNFSFAERNLLGGEKGKPLYRPAQNRALFGVCAGLANYFNIDISLVRIFWVLATIASHGIGLFVYLILIVILPDEATAEGETKNE